MGYRHGIRWHTELMSPVKKSKWRAYRNMHGRCNGPVGGHYYRYYGAKGITVCERWALSIDGWHNFDEDVPDPLEGLSLDRIKNRLGYFKENCRWATDSEQMSNRDPYHLSLESAKAIQVRNSDGRLAGKNNPMYGKKNPGATKRMNERNPMSNPASIQKMLETRKRNKEKRMTGQLNA